MLRLSPEFLQPGTVTDIDYAKSDKTRSFQGSKALSFNNSAGVATDYSISSGTVSDWYDQQQLTEHSNLLEHHRLVNQLIQITQIKEVVVETLSTLWLLMTTVP